MATSKKKSQSFELITSEDLHDIITIYIKGCDGKCENCNYAVNGKSTSNLECELQYEIDQINQKGYRKKTI